MSEPRVVNVPGDFSKTVYHEYECCRCHKTTQNSYSDPYRTQMLEKLLCFGCNYDDETIVKLEREHTTMTIIGGHIYGLGNRTTGSFRGMAGRRFDIEYIEPSIYAGQRITTFDLWSGSDVPAIAKERFPDTAKFLGDATKVDFPPGSMYESCWNPSSNEADPYPLPNTLKRRG